MCRRWSRHLKPKATPTAMRFAIATPDITAYMGMICSKTPKPTSKADPLIFTSMPTILYPVL